MEFPRSCKEKGEAKKEKADAEKAAGVQ